MKIRGAIDAEGRCKHWHSPLDVVANKCATCGEYFACALCHAELTDHEFGPMLVDAPACALRFLRPRDGLPAVFCCRGMPGVWAYV